MPNSHLACLHINSKNSLIAYAQIKIQHNTYIRHYILFYLLINYDDHESDQVYGQTKTTYFSHKRKLQNQTQNTNFLRKNKTKHTHKNLQSISMLYISLQNFEWVLIRWLSQLIVHHLHIPHSLHSSTHKEKHEKSNKLYKLDHKTATGFCLVLASDFLELNPPKTQQKKGEKEKVKERENRFPFLSFSNNSLSFYH